MPWLIRLGDALLVFSAGFLSLELRSKWSFTYEFPEDLTAYYNLIGLATLLFALLSNGVYQSWRGAALLSILAKVGVTWGAVVAFLLIWLFVFKLSHDFSRIWFISWALCVLFFLCVARMGVYLVLRHFRRRGFNVKRVVVVGKGEASVLIERRLHEAGWTGFQVVHFIRELSDENLTILQRNNFDEVWLALSMSDGESLRRILFDLRHSTAAIRFVPDLFTFRLINHGVNEVMGIAMYDLSTSPMTGFNMLLKGLEDKLIAIAILLLISPLLLFLSVGVMLSSPGPVFYRQERIGLNNRPFFMLKFRSMPVDTEKDGVQWGGSAAKATTRFGQFIRKASLDELPQFLNVLKGDMSIVGPRPERPMFVEQFKEEIPDYMKKHMVKAGITGWAQVHGWRGDTDLKTRIEYDLYYIENWSLWLDLKIIVMTVFKGFVNKNAY
ncbi:undecaprenyl-phosphate glucose phosphotransferase [Fluviibacter sp.]